MGARRVWLACLIGYAVLVHAVIVVLAFGERGAGQSFEAELDRHLARLDRNVPPGAVLFIGSSSIQGVDAAFVATRGVNMGIGGETIDRTIARMGDYHSPASAAAVVLAIGFNDLRIKNGEAIVDHMRSLLASVPVHVPVVLNGLQEPTQPRHRALAEAAAAVNRRYRDLCNRRPSCEFLDLMAEVRGDPDCRAVEVFEPDGIHFNHYGYQCWMRAMQRSIGKVT